VFVFKAFVRHHMTPVAGTVTNTEQNRFVFGLRALKGFVTPGIPVHRVIGVLAEVGAGFMLEAVHHSSFQPSAISDQLSAVTCS
jgi:hypothetical protein